MKCISLSRIVSEHNAHGLGIERERFEGRESARHDMRMGCIEGLAPLEGSSGAMGFQDDPARRDRVTDRRSRRRIGNGLSERIFFFDPEHIVSARPDHRHPRSFTLAMRDAMHCRS